MINRQMLVDPRVKGTITVYSERLLPPREAWSYLTALAGLGFAVVESGGLLKVVPEADAKLQTSGWPSDAHRAARRPGHHPGLPAEPREPEQPGGGAATADQPQQHHQCEPGNSSLVITDYADNLSRMAKIIAALDQPQATDIEIMPPAARRGLRHGRAAAEAGRRRRAPRCPGRRVGHRAWPTRSNSLIIRAPNQARGWPPCAADRAVGLARRWRPRRHPCGAPEECRRRPRRAALRRRRRRRRSVGGVASVSASPANLHCPARSPAPRAAAAATRPTPRWPRWPNPSTGGFHPGRPGHQLADHHRPDPLYRQIRAVIDQLDGRRAQVFVES